MWVVVARAVGPVEATFPNGPVGRAEAADGVAVLAAYADARRRPPSELADDVVEVTGLPGLAVEEGPTVTIADGSAGCVPDDPGRPTVGPPVDLTMPEPGEPPADEDAARAEITELLSAYGGDDPDTQVGLARAPGGVARRRRCASGRSTRVLLEWAKEVYGVVHEIVFTAPDRASVRRSLVATTRDPAPGERIGEAVLIDGVWKIVDRDDAAPTSRSPGIECDYSIEG